LTTDKAYCIITECGILVTALNMEVVLALRSAQASRFKRREGRVDGRSKSR